MQRNMGTIDRIGRAVLIAPVAVVAAVALGAASIGGIALLAFAGLMVATAASGYCPLYALLGISTTGRRPLSHA
jgi:hypothetical protein